MTDTELLAHFVDLIAGVELFGDDCVLCVELRGRIHDAKRRPDKNVLQLLRGERR